MNFWTLEDHKRYAAEREETAHRHRKAEEQQDDTRQRGRKRHRR